MPRWPGTHLHTPVPVRTPDCTACVLRVLVFTQDFEVFYAPDEPALYDKIADGDTAWCGLERLISGHRHTCNLSITPFQTTFVGIVPSQGHRLFSAGAQPYQLCRYATHECIVCEL